MTAAAGTTFAATHHVAAGTAAVRACNSRAHVDPQTRFSASVGGYEVSAVSITTASTCAGLSYRLSVQGTDGRQLGERSGNLNRDGSATAALDDGIAAASMNGVSLVVSSSNRIHYAR